MTAHSTRRHFIQGSVALGGIAALAACGQKSSDEQAKDAKAKNDKAADDAAALPGTAWTRADYDKVKDGGTLHYSVGQLPDNWNDFQADGALVDLNTILGPLRSSTLMIQEDGSYKINADFVESAELTSEDPQIVTVKFNKKAVWENGDPIVVKDLISQWKATRGKDDAFEVASTTGWEQIKDVRQKDDEYTCEIEYSSKFADWVEFIYPDLPQSVTKDAETFNKGFVDEPTPARGPYKVSKIDASAKIVTLERNDKWWGRKGKLDTIIFSVVSQTQMPSAFANSELDIIDVADGDTLAQAKSRSDAAIQNANGLTWTHLTMNTEGGDGALSDVKVRQAMATALNRDAVGQAVVGPLEAPIQLVDNFVFMPGQEGYDNSYELNGAKLEYDKDGAAKMLEDAGWKLDGDVRKKDGKSLSLKIVVPADTKSNSDRAQQVMKDLNAIGMDVTLDTVPTDGYFDDYINVKNYDLATFSWQGTAFPQQSAPNIFYPVKSNQNYTNLDLDDKLKAPVEGMYAELDQKKRLKDSSEFSKIVAGAYSVIPFYATPTICAVKKGLVNIGATQFESVDWTQVGYTS
jgi:peptide/nickel transport system substrate-binding protein